MFKKIILVFLFVITLTTAVYALTSPTSTTALNASTYVAINVTSGDGCYNVIYYANDGTNFVPFMLANDADGTNAHLIIGSMTEKICVRGGVAFFAKSLSATPNLVIKPGTK